MQTIILLNIIGLIIFFTIYPILLIKLIKTYKYITKIENQLTLKEQENKRYVNKIKELTGDCNNKGFNLGEKQYDIRNNCSYNRLFNHISCNRK